MGRLKDVSYNVARYLDRSHDTSNLTFFVIMSFTIFLTGFIGSANTFKVFLGLTFLDILVFVFKEDEINKEKKEKFDKLIDTVAGDVV